MIKHLIFIKLIFYFNLAFNGANFKINLKVQGTNAEFLLKIVLQFLLGKIAARLISKIKLKSLHIVPGVETRNRITVGIC